MVPSDLFLMIILNTAWAYNFIAGKAGVAYFQPLFFTFLRFAILLVLTFPFLRWVPGQMKKVFSLGIVLGVFHFSFMFAGLAAAGDISSVAIAVQLGVPFAAILALILLKESLDWRKFFGIAIAFAGVVVIGFDPIVFNNIAGLLLVSCAAFCFAVATIIMRQIHGVGVFCLQGWIALMAVPAQLLLSLWLEDNQLTLLQSATWLDFFNPAYSALGASLIGHGLMYHLLTKYPVNVTTPYTLLAPILAVVFGVVLWGDSLTWKLMMGGAATLAGIAMTNMPGYRLKSALRVSNPAGKQSQ
ncbi:MAG: DMT family transporter [Deltaproteobacteria bacterium]|nr:DMT family transporter [Deltaproteobacteria bacterium]